KVIEVSGLVQVSGIITISGHVKFIGTNEGTLQWTKGFWNAIVVNEGASATFEDVTLDGNDKTFDRSALLFKGTVAFNAGTIVKSFESTGYARAEEGTKGVIAVFEKGILNIYDGAMITGNTSERGGIISIYQDQDQTDKETTATLNMYGGTIEKNGTCTDAVIWNWFGYLNIYGGTVKAGGNVYAVEGRGNMTGFQAVTKIYGGTFEGEQKGAVCAGHDTDECQCDFTITGGVFSGRDAITVRECGTINIAGGKFTGTQYALKNQRGSLTVEGGEFFGESNAYYGTINTMAKEVVVGSSENDRENWDGSTSLNTYKYVMIGWIDENGINHHNTVLENAGVLTSGSYYLDEDKAFDEPVIIPDGATVNLCLNGHKLECTGPEDNTVDAAVIVNKGGTLNLRDCSTDGCGSIKGTNTAIGVLVNGTFNIDSGKVEGNIYGINGTGDG
ncbi:MAG: hypothetical protein K2K09_00660, partial [Lachnospiraceae bacterium]|nr:hypothetical protein [Lachnospiraceae bacterium]